MQQIHPVFFCVYICMRNWINYKNIREVDTIVLMVMLIITDS